MRELTTRDILEHAAKIETESFAFYSLAAEAMTDKGLKELCRDLAEQEKGHLNNVRALLKTLGPGRTVPAPAGTLERLIVHGEVSPRSTPREILTIAHQRELNTRQFYQTMLALTDLGPDMVKLFEELMRQEELHAESVKKRLERLTSS
ncbi:MAG TPA: ferritin family protein [bacterium]|nr:ferritin family protein [bacterium]